MSKNKVLLTDPLDDNNPITVQVLGICSALAITVQLKAAIVMSLSVVAVMGASNVIVSILRNFVLLKKNFLLLFNIELLCMIFPIRSKLHC